jgi:hypothetical protein
VLGRTFEWRSLRALTALGDDAIVAALESAVERQLLAFGAAEFRFRHALTREAVLAGAIPPLVQSFARRALEELGPGSERAASLAELAGDPGEAARRGCSPPRRPAHCAAAHFPPPRRPLAAPWHSQRTQPP